jgi:hypothetical protein
VFAKGTSTTISAQTTPFIVFAKGTSTTLSAPTTLFIVNTRHVLILHGFISLSDLQEEKIRNQFKNNNGLTSNEFHKHVL